MRLWEWIDKDIARRLTCLQIALVAWLREPAAHAFVVSELLPLAHARTRNDGLQAVQGGGIFARSPQFADRPVAEENDQIGASRRIAQVPQVWCWNTAVRRLFTPANERDQQSHFSLACSSPRNRLTSSNHMT